jgi:hypothetical protein
MENLELWNACDRIGVQKLAFEALEGDRSVIYFKLCCQYY